MSLDDAKEIVDGAVGKSSNQLVPVKRQEHALVAMHTQKTWLEYMEPHLYMDGLNEILSSPSVNVFGKFYFSDDLEGLVQSSLLTCQQ